MKLTDITFFANTEYLNTDELIKAQSVSLNYIPVLSTMIEVEVIKHIAGRQTTIIPHKGFRFFQGNNHFFHAPLKSINHIKNSKADILLVHGFQFPFQILLLRMFLGKQKTIILKHHADKVSKGFKKWFQIFTDKYIDAYLFISKELAAEWLDGNVISSENKIYELPGTLSGFKQLEKISSRQKLGLKEGLHYLWVGRLNANKDPLTILTAFEEFLKEEEHVTIHFFYQTTELIQDMQSYISRDAKLKKAVILHGIIENKDLELWYSATDFFISSSYSEGGSTALLEAMSCGCIPIVTSIPAALEVTKNGKYGYHFQPGNVQALYEILKTSASSEREKFAAKMIKYFNESYSIEAVCKKMLLVFEDLRNQK